jgi:reticulon-4
MQTAGTLGGRRRLSVKSIRSSTTAAAASASVWEARMKMDEVKVFRAGTGDEPADEDGVRVYCRLRRNQSEGGGGAAAGFSAATTASAKKRRSWKASEPVTAIGEQLRKSRSDAAVTASAVVARGNVARVSTPEKKVAPAPAIGEVKEVVVVEVAERAPPPPPSEEDDEELEEELETEGEEEEHDKEELDQDRMAVDEDDAALHQGKLFVIVALTHCSRSRFVS